MQKKKTAKNIEIPITLSISYDNSNEINIDDNGIYRFNLKMPIEYKHHLDHQSWLDHTTVTQYINNLIDADIIIKKRSS